jgi:nucleoside-diphosphate-sugar epimerase
MKVLVTGAEGWIGSRTVAELTARGHEVFGTSRYGRDAYTLDVCDRAAVTAMVSRFRPARIVNLAGILGTAELAGREHAAAAVNILGAINVLDAAAHTGAHVVHIGTGHKGQPNTYAITKAAAEDLALARRHPAVTIVRAYHTYGPGQAAPPPCGTATVRKIVPSFVCRALTNQPLQIFGDGSNVIDLVHVEDVAAVLADAVEHGKPGQTWEAGTGQPLTVQQVAEDVIRATHSDAPIVHCDARSGEPVGAQVVASWPRCPASWPDRLPETIEHYRRLVTSG